MGRGELPLLGERWSWWQDNIEAWINVAGSLLGVAKAMTAFLSGEMRDTVELVRVK
jgi:phospholipid:diacylglycerol acyltransferase